MSNTTEILKRYRTIAVVGLSNKRFRASYGVSEYMQAARAPDESSIDGMRAAPLDD